MVSESLYITPKKGISRYHTVQCFLTILQSVQQGDFAVCIFYIAVDRGHINTAHTCDPAIKACKQTVMSSSCQ